MATEYVGEVALEIGVDTAKVDKQLDKLVKKKRKAIIDVHLNDDNIDKKLDKTADKKRKAKIEAEADAKKASDELDKAADKKRTAKIDADLSKDSVGRRLAALARDRVVNFRPKVNERAFNTAQAALSKMSGGAALQNLASSTFDLFKNMDTLAPKLGVVATGFIGLSGAALAATSSLSGFGYALVQMGGAALALPGLFMGAAAGVGTLTVVLKDAKKVLKDLGPQFTALQQSMSGAFWGQAEAPIRQLVANSLPTLQRGLVGISTELGTWASSLGGGLERSLGSLNTILGNTRAAIHAAAKGTDAWVTSFMRLSAIGSSYLPKLASEANAVGASFNSWVRTNEANGNIVGWIDNGIAQIKLFGGILGDTLGVFKALGQAAQQAGAQGLLPMALAMDALNKSMNSSTGMASLVGVFSAARKSVETMLPGLSQLVSGLGSLGAVVVKLLPVASQGLGNLFGGLGAVLGSPAVGQGLTSLVTGFVGFTQALKPVAPILGQVVGSILRLAGTALPVLGQVFSAAIKNFGPAIVSIANGLRPLVEVLGAKLVAALNVVGPPLSSFISSLMGWVQNNPGITASILGTAVALGSIVKIGTKLAGPIEAIKKFRAEMGVAGTAANTFSKVFSGIGGMLSKAFGFITSAASKLVPILLNVGKFFVATPWGLAITAIVAVGAALYELFKHNQAFHDGVMSTWGQIQALWGQVSDWFVNTALPAFLGAWQATINWFAGLPAFFGGLWGSISSSVSGFFATIGATLTSWGTGISTFFSGIWASIGNGLATMANGIMAVVGPPLNTLDKIVSVLWAALVMYSQQGWAAITGMFSAGWAQVTAITQAAWNGLTTAFTAGWAIVSTWTSAQWAALTGAFTAGWNMLKGITVAGWAVLSGAFVTGWQKVVSVFSGAWTWVSRTFAVWWNTLAGPTGILTRVFAQAQAYISARFTAIIANFAALWGWVSKTFAGWWNLLAGENGIITRPFRAALNFVGARFRDMRASFTNLWVWASSAFAKMWSGIVGVFMRPINAMRDAIVGPNGALERIKSGFRSAVSAIGTIWGGLSGALKLPVIAARDHVVNPMIHAFNGLADKVGMKDKHLADWKPFYNGGWTGNVGKRVVAGVVHGKEFVMDAFTTARAGGARAMEVIRQAVRAGWSPIKHGVEALSSLPARTGGIGPSRRQMRDGAGGKPGYLRGGYVWPTSTRTLSNNYRGHSGVDIAAGMGSPLYATENGTVYYVGTGKGYGIATFLRGEDGVPWVYGHQSRPLVKAGQSVTKGQLIGYSGNTGHSSGPHLHIEAAENGRFAVPSNRNYTLGLLGGSIMGKAVAGIGSAIGNLFGKFSSAKDWIGDKFKSLMPSLDGIGTGFFPDIVKQLPKTISDGLGSFASGLFDKFNVTDIPGVSGVADWIKGKLGRGVERWRSVAIDAAKAAGLPIDYIDLLLKRMNVESGGNPNAQNNWDINAKNGVPSQGLMQVIPPTFQAYAGPYAGRGIRDPFANIYAAIKYSLKRYGLSGLSRAWGGTHGYANGTTNAAPGWALVGERGPELMSLSRGTKVLTAPKTRSILQSSNTQTTDMSGDRIENLNVTVALEDLRQLNDISDFLDMLSRSRATARKSMNSGRVAY